MPTSAFVTPHFQALLNFRIASTHISSDNRRDSCLKPCYCFLITLYSLIIHPEKFSEKYFLSDEERYFKDKAQVTNIVLSRKEKVEIPVDVTESGSMIQWEFLVKHKDIGFGLFYEVSVEEREEVLPIQKYDTIDGTEEGSYKCHSVGKYIIVFDNSYSWMNSKEIEYIITVVKIKL